MLFFLTFFSDFLQRCLIIPAQPRFAVRSPQSFVSKKKAGIVSQNQRKVDQCQQNKLLVRPDLPKT
jgi:hypothetical protein